MQHRRQTFTCKGYCCLECITKTVVLKILVLAVIILNCQTIHARTVKIGIYDNPPKVESGTNEKPSGIFIDIIEYIAKQENWRIQYMHGDWEGGLARLENGEIDLMPDVAYSKERSKRFDFNQLAVLSSWLQIFSRKNIHIASIEDLNGKTVAVLKKGIQENVIRELRSNFNLNFTIIPLPDYESTVDWVESGKADLMLSSRFYGYKEEKPTRLVSTPVVLHPTTLHFASAKGRNADLLSAIDKHVSEIMNDPGSVYYQSLVYWLHEQPKKFVPFIIVWILVAISVALILAFILNFFLRWKIKQRTLELQEKNRELLNALNELQTARNEALKAERLHAFGQVAGGVAHDFNNILVPILGYADLLLQDPQELEDKENVRENLEIIRTASERGVHLVQRMKHFWRLNEEEEEMIPINQVVQEVVDLAKGRWKGHSFSGAQDTKVRIHMDKGLEIFARRSELHALFLNLILNAADAMPNGGAMDISCKKVADHIKMTFRDTGKGMTEEEKQKCLEPFFTTKGEDGTGMGLSVVAGIVAEYGGQIDIESFPGKGTCFIITFPVKHG